MMKVAVAFLGLVMLGGCGSQAQVAASDDTKIAEAHTADYWASGMTEASDRMDAAASVEGQPAEPRHKRSLDSYYAQGSEQEMPFDAPESDWGR